MDKKIKIIVATHKKYEMPKDTMYVPLQVGTSANGEITGYEHDNIGKNISEKNPYYCELTGLYWAWKNLKCDYIGLVHYRRYLTNKKIVNKKKNKFDCILSEKDVKNILEETDVILPKKRNYYIENLYDHYKHTHYIEQLEATGRIIKRKYPNYYSEFEKLHIRKKAHMFNIMIMKKDILDKYCNWLFSILEELEKEMNGKKYNKFQDRFYGRVSELLLDIWINTNNIKYKEVRVIDMDNINWLKKGTSFLIAKFFGKKYKGSF